MREANSRACFKTVRLARDNGCCRVVASVIVRGIAGFVILAAASVRALISCSPQRSRHHAVGLIGAARKSIKEPPQNAVECDRIIEHREMTSALNEREGAVADALG